MTLTVLLAADEYDAAWRLRTALVRSGERHLDSRLRVPQAMTSSLPAEVDAESLRVVMKGRGDAVVFWTQVGSAPSPAGSYELRSARRSCLRMP